MTANIVTVIAVVAGIAWLGVLFVSAIRNRGDERVPANLKPGINDEELETKRLETGQKAAIAFSAFLAISLPLYFLSEPARQEGFVEQFEHESEERGLHIVEEFACFSCHGPEGVGGTATFVEKRSGVTVSWAAPPLNDILYRYDEDELNFWITFGRGNTPMPAWGLPGGGPLNEEQVIDVVNYLRSIQITQSEAVNRVPDPVDVELTKLDNADAILAAAILEQEQVVAEIERAPADAEVIGPLGDRAGEVLDAAGEGIDTDGDGLSDSAEAELSSISQAAFDHYAVVADVVMDPATPDAEKADEAVATLEAAAEESNPIVTTNLTAVEVALAEGQVEAGGLSAASQEELDTIATSASELGYVVPPGPYDTLESGESLAAFLQDTAGEEGAPAELATLASEAAASVEAGSDPDGDGISTAAETEVTNQVADARTKVVPPEVTVIALDPTNAESVGGQADSSTASRFVGSLESLTTTLRVSAQNQDTLLTNELGGLEYLVNSAETRAFEIDISGVAAAMGVSEDEAARAVGLYNANCARCHTAGFSAGLPYTEEAGSGGFGPALWDGRPTVQFGDPVEPVGDDLLVQFLVRGSEAETPYGINGFGSGRMPAFGAILSAEDIQLLAAYLRSGNLDGKG